MEKHTLEILEFSRIRDELIDYCLSDDGRQEIEQRAFILEQPTLSVELKNLRLLKEKLLDEDAPTLKSFPAINLTLKTVQKEGAVIELEEILHIQQYLDSSMRLFSCFRETELWNFYELDNVDIQQLRWLENEIKKFVDETGEVKESSIPELSEISRRIKSIQKEIDNIAGGFLGQQQYHAYWQSDQPSFRDGRVVLPLKSNFKGRLDGIIHENSASGATSYFEPLPLLEKNNNLVEAKNQYNYEIFKIIKELSQKIRMDCENLELLKNRIALLDSLYARARYSILHDCISADSGDHIDLRKARHPLLGGTAVPISFQLVQGKRSCIISGPNTGGKTVFLKTVGLFSLMNQFGMEIPADSGTILPIFSSVFTDIGDEQSIDNALSTFSGHIQNISSILQRAEENSLVIVDELGSGTDPEEGSALAIAILDKFIETGCTILVTSHFAALKHYAYAHKSTENASVNFDDSQNKPLYTITIGVPGSSHALEIARQHGIDERIIENALSIYRDKQTNVGKMIEELLEKEAQLEKRNLQYREQVAKLAVEKGELQTKEQKYQEKLLQLQEEGLQSNNQVLEEYRKRMEQVISELQKMDTSPNLEGSDKIKKLRELTKGAEEKNDRLREEVEEGRKRQYQEINEALTEGMTVICGSARKEGVLEKKNRDGKWVVRLNNMRMTMPPDMITPIKKTPEKDVRKQVSVSVEKAPVTARPALELDVRGMRLEEALLEVQKQIDASLMTGMQSFSIIHGLGTGVLQQGIREFLNTQSEVKEHHYARPEEGGYGKSIITLRAPLK